jgi:arylsulfatase
MGPAGETGVGVLQKIEMRIDKREGCRKQAAAQNLGLVDRIRFVAKCMQ